MKIVVTGGTGFIGRPFVEHLAARGHNVIVAARHAPAYGLPDTARFVPFDMMSDDPVAVFDGPDVLVHLAWTGLPHYQDRIHPDQNLPASLRLMETMVQSGVGHILTTGTCLEYGMQEGCLSEQLQTQPVTLYGRAKDDLRMALDDLSRQRPFVLQWARLFYLYGPHQNPNSVLAQLDRALDNGDAVFNMSGGEQERDYLPVATAALMLTILLERKMAGVYNVCSGVPMTINALIENHLKACGRHITLNRGHYPYPDYEPMRFWGDASKIKAILAG
jgi:dTDP-6-deoxy-L-talose 4-dehydrogenase (NAD+)